MASSVAERAAKHFKGRQTLASIEVPEWPDDDGNPTVVYYFPVISSADQRRIFAAGPNEADIVLEALIVRARDGSGKAIFKPAERGELARHSDAEVIASIVRQMRVDQMSVEDAAGN